jgi:hypothetical protein
MSSLEVINLSSGLTGEEERGMAEEEEVREEAIVELLSPQVWHISYMFFSLFAMSLDWQCIF